MPKNDDLVSNQDPAHWLLSCAELEHKADFPADPPKDTYPYPWCRKPAVCRNRGSCPLDPNCGE